MIVQAGQRSVRYIRKDHVEATQLDDEWMLLNLNRYTITKVNEVGGFFWSLLEEEHTVESLVQAIVNEYEPDLPCDNVKQNIEDFLTKLIEYGLIENVSD